MCAYAWWRSDLVRPKLVLTCTVHVERQQFSVNIKTEGEGELYITQSASTLFIGMGTCCSTDELLRSIAVQ